MRHPPMPLALAMAGDVTTAADLWRPVENLGRIRTIEREAGRA